MTNGISMLWQKWDKCAMTETANDRLPVIAIAGPTASGKTALAIALAERLDAEIVSADAMQIYRGFDIGTAKPTTEEMRGIPHHMLNFLPPETTYSVAQYRRDAIACIERIWARGKRVIVCGGTGQYMQALTMPMDYARSASDAALRQQYEQIAAEQGNTALQRELAQLDPVSAERIHLNDTKRLIRALEVCRLTGRPFSQHDNAPPPVDPVCKIGLAVARSVLVRRIDTRVDEMVRHGLFDEIIALQDKGVTLDMPGAAAIGYKELWEAARCSERRPAAIERLKIATRQYAKRQMTWFRKDPAIQWVDAATESGAAMVSHAMDLIESGS